MPHDDPAAEDNTARVLRQRFGITDPTSVGSTVSKRDSSYTVVSGFSGSDAWAVWWHDGEVVFAFARDIKDPGDRVPCDIRNTFSDMESC